MAVACEPAAPSNVTLVSSCPRQPIPIPIEVDCSHLKDSEVKELCSRFAENQACKVFPALRKITGIHVEEQCSAITYTIYDRDNWPNAGAAGGISIKCRVDYLAQYALTPNAKSAIGPYEVHEMLHQYHLADETLDELTAFHALFLSSILEVERELGNVRAYELGVARLKEDNRNHRFGLDQAAVPPADRCMMAQSLIEKDLYLQNSRNVYQFYRMLAKRSARTPASRVSSMLSALAGDTAKQFLLAHGCEAF
jgi:hypothetical protein